jgi:hypothetical protein
MLSLKDKQRLTLVAIKEFIAALPDRDYMIRLVHAETGRAIKREWRTSELLHSASIRFLRARNFEGFHVYIRPADCSFVLIDLDTDPLGAIQQMKADGLPIWLIVESSPGKRQVWTSVGRRGEVTKDEAHECARLLARRYGGDPGSAKAFQLGRAPGFYNRKSCHRNDKGHYPRVIARGIVSTRIAHDVMAEAREALNAPSPRPRVAPVTMRSSPVYLTGAEFQDAIEHAHRWTEFYDDRGRLWFRFTMPTIKCLETAYSDVLDYMVEHCGYEAIARRDGHVDRSKQDFAVAQTMLRLGFEADFVFPTLRVGSEKAQERSDSEQYVLSTIRSAAHRVEIWS